MKVVLVWKFAIGASSHPARGAWIEMRWADNMVRRAGSHPARGAWIEISIPMPKVTPCRSHPARGAWIEIP